MSDLFLSASFLKLQNKWANEDANDEMHRKFDEEAYEADLTQTQPRRAHRTRTQRRRAQRWRAAQRRRAATATAVICSTK